MSPPLLPENIISGRKTNAFSPMFKICAYASLDGQRNYTNVMKLETVRWAQ